MSYLKSYNFNINDGKDMKLSELFSSSFDYKKVIDNIISSEISKNSENYFSENFKGISDLTEFYLTHDGIVIYYQPYEIAPYSAGIPKFKILYSELAQGVLFNNN